MKSNCCLLATALLMLTLVAQSDAQLAPRQRAQRFWTPLFLEQYPEPEDCIRYLALDRQGAVPISRTLVTWRLSNRSERVLSVTVENPGLDEVTAVALYWHLYDEADLTAPVASGITKPKMFDRPLVIHDLGTVTMDLDVPGACAAGASHIVVGIDAVAYKNGSRWSRTP